MLHLLGSLLTLAFVVLDRAAESEQTPPVRIALLSDTHSNRSREGNAAKYKTRLDRVIADINAAKVDLALVAGDLSESGQPEQMEDFRAQIQALEAPARFVPGNHDVGDKRVPGKEGGVTASRVKRYEQALGPSFFVEVRAGLRVIGLNASLLGSGLPREADQWAFLESELAGPSRLPTVVLLHNPLFTQKPDEPGDPYWNVEPQPRERLLRLLKKGRVRMVLSGHLHRGLTLRHDGILHVTTPPVSFGLPPGKQPEGWTLISLPARGEPVVEFHPRPD